MSIVETQNGKVEGKGINNVEEFLGIPFAKPPIGELRFRGPQKPEPWSDVKSCTEFGGSAPQDKIPLMEVGRIDEDCLYLNVWTPACDGKKRPVLYWIHGGGFFIGSGAQAEYNGAMLAERGDVVVVSVNYRLGALGFAQIDEVLNGVIASDSNLGIRDQVAGLEWVRDNIEAFGGDKDNVTIFGESAGGMSVGTLMGVPSAVGLFHKAIPQSGAGHNAISKADAGKVAEKLLSELGISQENANDIYDLPYEKILKAQRKCSTVPISSGPWELPSIGMAFVPVIDGDFLPDHPVNMVANGLSKDVKLLVGTTAEEWKLFAMITNMIPQGADLPDTLPDWIKVGEENITEAIDSQLPGKGEAGVRVYKETLEENTANDIFTALQTDKIFTQPALRFAEAHKDHQDEIYMYRFDWKSPMLGACHAVDIPFVFGGINSQFGMMFTGGSEDAQKLSEQVQDAWVNFARSGSPAHSELPDWPKYCLNARSTMIFDKNCTVIEKPNEEIKIFWDAIQ